MHKPGTEITLLGFDISSTSSGWASMDYESGRLLKFGAIRPGGEWPERLKQTRDSVCYILNEQRPTFVGIETPVAFRNGKIAKMLDYFTGVTFLTAYDFNGNEPYLIPSTSLKKAIGLNPMPIKKAAVEKAIAEGWTKSKAAQAGTEAVKEAVYQKVCCFYRISIPESSPDFKSRYDITDAITCAMKLRELTRRPE